MSLDPEPAPIPDVQLVTVTRYGWRCNDCGAENDNSGWITASDAENDMAGHECEVSE